MIVFWIIGLVGISYSQHVQPKEELSCSTCIHVALNVSNVPGNDASAFEKMISMFGFNKPECLHGNNVKRCLPSNPSSGVVSRCQSTTVYMKARGIKAFANMSPMDTKTFPDATMNMQVMVKGCTLGPAAEGNKCIQLKDMDIETINKLTRKFKGLERQWENVNYTGEMCILDNDEIARNTSRMNKMSKNAVSISDMPKNMSEIYDPINSATYIDRSASYVLTLFVLTCIVINFTF